MAEEVGEALELDTRRRIYDLLTRVPGLHMREIGRELDIPMGTLEYHLHYMTRGKLLVTRQDARYVRYFVEGSMDRREKDVLAVLRQDTPRRIAAFLVMNPGVSHGRIHEEFDVSASTLSFHLKKLLRAKIARKEKRGRENLYWIEDPELVARVLVKHQASFLDDVVDRFTSVWMDLAPRDTERGSGRTRGGGVLAVFARLLAGVASA